MNTRTNMQIYSYRKKSIGMNAQTNICDKYIKIFEYICQTLNCHFGKSSKKCLFLSQAQNGDIARRVFTRDM